jgi:hypothetical protein
MARQELLGQERLAHGLEHRPESTLFEFSTINGQATESINGQQPEFPQGAESE